MQTDLTGIRCPNTKKTEVAKAMGLVESTITEGYESKVREICKVHGVDCSSKDGKMYVAQEDMANPKSIRRQRRYFRTT